MSDNDAKDMEEFQDSLHGSEDGVLEQKIEFTDDHSNEAEDVETIDEIADTLRQVDFGAASGETSHQSSHAEKTGQKTIEQWLTRDNLVVYPVWIGNLPRETSVPDLRRFLECEIGRVLISVHISPKRNSNERTYAFLNLPTAEKQILAVTLLDGTVFHGEKLIVRSKRPSKFPQSFFGSSPISDHFKHFRDCVVPAILAAPTVNLNVHAVKRIMEEHTVGLDHLPNRVWCVQCTLTPNCHRTYCSFYHNQEERELGRIISILAAQNCNDSGETNSGFDMSTNENGEILKRPVAVSRHTLLIEGLPKSVSTQKLTEMFEVFGEIDHVIVNPNNTCFLRMKRSQDARKIVHLLNMNNSGIQIQFAPYAANPHLMSALRSASAAKRSRSNEKGNEGSGHGRSFHGGGRSGRAGRPNLNDQGWSHDTMDSDVTSTSLPSFVAGGSASGGYPSKPTTNHPRPQHSNARQSGSAGSHTARVSGSRSSGYAMPHAPPPPAAIFKEDDMAYMHRPQHPYQSVSTGYEYMDDGRSGVLTPTTDYRGYGVMGYGTPTSDWGSANMYTAMGYPSYGHYYPYQQSAGMPQLSPFSASDPMPYHSGHHHSFAGYQQTHPGYQREQPSRYRHRRHEHQQFARADVSRTGPSRRQEREAGTMMTPQTSVQAKPKNGRTKSISSDPAMVQGFLDEIPGL